MTQHNTSLFQIPQGQAQSSALNTELPLLQRYFVYISIYVAGTISMHCLRFKFEVHVLSLQCLYYREFVLFHSISVYGHTLTGSKLCLKLLYQKWPYSL